MHVLETLGIQKGWDHGGMQSGCNGEGNKGKFLFSWGNEGFYMSKNHYKGICDKKYYVQALAEKWYE